MSDNRPRSDDRKLSLIAPISIALAVFVILIVALLWRGRSVDPDIAPPVPVTQAPAAAPAPDPALPASPQPLTRADLLSAAAAAADRYAGGDAAPPSEALTGRPFLIRIAFGCPGGLSGGLNAQASALSDPIRRTVKLVAAPADWSMLPLVQALPDNLAAESVEGFWLPYEWRSMAGCPPASSVAPAPAPTAPATSTIGLAVFHREDSSRLTRRGPRPFEFIRRAPEGETDLLTRAYWLVLEGRIVGYPDGAAVKCWSETPEHRPICLFAVALDRVAFEDQKTSEILAQW